LIGIVDDDESLRLAVDALLRSVGYRSVGFASGEDFLSSEKSAAVQCLILDWRMPSGMDGLELQRHLAARGNHLPGIFLTAHGNESLCIEAMSRGAVAFLSKPFDADVLLNAVFRALNS